MTLPVPQPSEDNNINKPSHTSSSTFQNKNVTLKLRLNPIANINTRSTQTDIDYDFGHEPEGKNIILCFDGTQKNFDSLPYSYSNVLRLVNILEADTSKQICYYQPGINSPILEYDKPSPLYFVSKFVRDMKSWFSTHITPRIEENVLLAYKYLMRTYKTGYKLYFFGFSQGALVARILAAMIEKVGLLNPGMEELIPSAWSVYTSWELAGQPGPMSSRGRLAKQFKLFFSHGDVDLRFMGLWDALNSSRSFRDRVFPLTVKNDQVEHIRHALSIDERRASLKPSSFHPYYCRSSEKHQNKWLPHHMIYKYGDKNIKKNITTAEKNPKRMHSDVIEMWFPGDHSDVGGGWVPDCDSEYLSFIPARWMIAEAYKFGLRYRMDEIKKNFESWSSNFSLLAEDHDLLSFKSIKLKNCQNDKKPKDSMNNIRIARNDQCDGLGLVYKEDSFGGHGNKSMFRTIGYWMLEILPIPHRSENEKRRWVKTYKPNFGHRRNIPSNAKFHWSVKWRMKLVNSYNPKNLPSSFDNRIEEDDTIPDDFKDILGGLLYNYNQS